jgi:hypothetical protein
VAISRMRAQSHYLNCEIVVSDPEDRASPGRATCTDARTGAVIGFRSIPRGSGDGRQTVDADEVIRMIGGAYRLVSIAVEIETEILGRRNRGYPTCYPCVGACGGGGAAPGRCIWMRTRQRRPPEALRELLGPKGKGGLR